MKLPYRSTLKNKWKKAERHAQADQRATVRATAPAKAPAPQYDLATRQLLQRCADYEAAYAQIKEAQRAAARNDLASRS